MLFHREPWVTLLLGLPADPPPSPDMPFSFNLAPIPPKGPILAVMATRGLGPAREPNCAEGLERRQVEGGNGRMR